MVAPNGPIQQVPQQTPQKLAAWLNSKLPWVGRQNQPNELEAPSRKVYDATDNTVFGGLYVFDNRINVRAKHDRNILTTQDLWRNKFVRNRVGARSEQYRNQQKEYFKGVFTGKDSSVLDSFKKQVAQSKDVFANFTGVRGNNLPSLNTLSQNNVGITNLFNALNKTHDDHEVTVEKLCRKINAQLKSHEENLANPEYSKTQVVNAMRVELGENLAELKQSYKTQLADIDNLFDPNQQNHLDDNYCQQIWSMTAVDVQTNLKADLKEAYKLQKKALKDTYTNLKSNAFNFEIPKHLTMEYIVGIQGKEITDPIRKKLEEAERDRRNKEAIRLNIDVSLVPENVIRDIELSDLDHFQTKNGNIITRNTDSKTGKVSFSLLFRASATDEEIRSDLNDLWLAAKLHGCTGMDWTAKGTEEQKKAIMIQQFLISAQAFKIMNPNDQAMVGFDNCFTFNGGSLQSQLSPSEYAEALKQLEVADKDYGKVRAQDEIDERNPSPFIQKLNNDYIDKHVIRVEEIIEEEERQNQLNNN